MCRMAQSQQMALTRPDAECSRLQVAAGRGIRPSWTCWPATLPPLSCAGGSGAGKTTLLDLLACNTSASSSGSSAHGSVTVNGGRQDAREFTKLSCYVQQKDLLYASATVGVMIRV